MTSAMPQNDANGVDERAHPRRAPASNGFSHASSSRDQTLPEPARDGAEYDYLHHEAASADQREHRLALERERAAVLERDAVARVPRLNAWKKDDVDETIEWLVRGLAHASSCRDERCGNDLCGRLRLQLAHATRCRQLWTGQCPGCRTTIGLCHYHARDCIGGSCPVRDARCTPPTTIRSPLSQVPYCREIRVKIAMQRDRGRMTTMTVAHAPVIEVPMVPDVKFLRQSQN